MTAPFEPSTTLRLARLCAELQSEVATGTADRQHAARLVLAGLFAAVITIAGPGPGRQVLEHDLGFMPSEIDDLAQTFSDITPS